MAAEHSLLIETLREITELLSDKNLAQLIKSEDLGATVEDFCNLVEVFDTSQGLNAFGDGSNEELEQTLQSISHHLATFSRHNLIELKKLDFVKDIKPKT